MFSIAPATALWFLPFVAPIALWVAWSDMATMKIPNKAVLALLVVFAVIGLVALPFTDYLWRYLHFVVALIVTFLMNLARMMGAGDSKFIAAMAPFIPMEDVYPFIFLLAAVIVGAIVTHRIARATPSFRNRVPDWESWTHAKFPMGFALAPALVIYLILGAFAG